MPMPPTMAYFSSKCYMGARPVQRSGFELPSVLFAMLLVLIISTGEGFLARSTTTTRTIGTTTATNKMTIPLLSMAPRHHDWFGTIPSPFKKEGNNPSKGGTMDIDEDKLLSFLEDAVEELHQRNKNASKEYNSNISSNANDDGNDEESSRKFINQEQQNHHHLAAVDKNIKLKELENEKVAKRFARYEEQLLAKDSEIERLRHELDKKHTEIEKKAEEERLKLEAMYVSKLDKKNHLIYALQLKIKQTKKQVLALLAEDMEKM